MFGSLHSVARFYQRASAASTLNAAQHQKFHTGYARPARNRATRAECSNRPLFGNKPILVENIAIDAVMAKC